ncbi:SDR family NAD(P)-dependent oxidoreductase [Shewanella baltica]|uniref:3-oxoacyl-[acyl-carrier-protein] reductase n=1 Tax=Shewanella baltica (strain OS155 / ATCC BAA-1091) TaxID=325240 RepID=A3D6S9_SHEB5|nr:3-oxoacyl-ACP reductase family protein [Shewanella baltica]ABN62442.1 3-oxoacyl-[acyl-carrier-protein] reductase [Shewanella baltica OS155]AEH14787.1 3-oxoacyl-(acyl-carrier-protein) reductase [Shewanella baltica OS117]
MGRLTGKVALITGASRGIGAGIAEAFAIEGADLIINYRTNDDAAFRVVSKLKNLGRKVVAIRADVSKRSEIQNLIHLAQIEFGRIDILVNNAGINQRGWFNEVTDEAWDMIMGTNLKGPFMCCQEVFPLMKANGGGRIINISSVAGQYHGPKTVHYAVSKAGLNSLTKVLARYGAEYNVLVNAVAPGLVRTDQTIDEIDSPAGARVLDMTLLKKAGRIEDISSACVFLASDEQQYMTGQILAVSGGAILDN